MTQGTGQAIATLAPPFTASNKSQGGQDEDGEEDKRANWESKLTFTS